MATVTSGVYPVFKNVFKFGKSGTSSAAADMVTVADLTTFSVAISGNVEEWTPMTTEGWTRRLMTGKISRFPFPAKEMYPTQEMTTLQDLSARQALMRQLN